MLYYDTQSLQAIDIDEETGKVILTTTTQQQDILNGSLANLVLMLGQAKKSAICFAFRSLIRPLPLRGEGTPLGKENKSRFILLFARLFVPLHLKNRVALCMG